MKIKIKCDNPKNPFNRDEGDEQDKCLKSKGLSLGLRPIPCIPFIPVNNAFDVCLGLSQCPL
jgi:hypothetical protein